MSSHSRPHPAPAPSYQRAAGCLSTSDDSHGRILQNAGASKIEPEEGGGQSPPPPSHPPTPTPCTAPSPFPPHLHCLLLISGMGWGMESWEEDGSKKPGPSGVAGVSEVSLLPPSAEWEQLGGACSAASPGWALVPTLLPVSLSGHQASSCPALQGSRVSLSWQRDGSFYGQAGCSTPRHLPQTQGLCRMRKLSGVQGRSECRSPMWQMRMLRPQERKG